MLQYLLYHGSTFVKMRVKMLEIHLGWNGSIPEHVLVEWIFTFLGSVDHEEVPGREDEHVAHDPPGRHVFSHPVRVRVGHHETAAVPEGLQKSPLLPLWVGQPVRLGLRTAAHHNLDLDLDLDLDVVVVRLVIQLYREESRRAGCGVVPGTAQEPRELLDHLVAERVEEDGSAVGEDEEVSIGKEVDEGVQVILVEIRGLVNEGGVDR